MQATNKVQWKCLVGGAKKWKSPYLEKKLLYENNTLHLVAKKIAQERHQFMIIFLSQFYAEWDGEK